MNNQSTPAQRSLKDYLGITLKGICMGAADVVPGVSGGTIAFIVGIYDELINSIKAINLSTIKLLLQGKIKAFWTAINMNFLLSLLLGIGVSVFSLAKLITYLLAEQPVCVWSFFFGLVLASTWFVARDIKEWSSWKTITSFVMGALIAYYITIATPAVTSESLWFVFLCGAIAICAMILPGISGSFILVLMGKYYFIMDAVKELNLVVLGVFAGGALIGITSFSRLLSYALTNVRNMTLALLSGFMLGSLNKVWPWKIEETRMIDGHEVVLEHNAYPGEMLTEAIVLLLLGFFLVVILEKMSKSKSL